MGNVGHAGGSDLSGSEVVMEYVRYIGKALISGSIAFCGTLGTAYTDGHVTAGEWLTVAVTTLTSLSLVFKFRNGDNPDGSL